MLTFHPSLSPPRRAVQPKPPDGELLCQLLEARQQLRLLERELKRQRRLSQLLAGKKNSSLHHFCREMATELALESRGKCQLKFDNERLVRSLREAETELKAYEKSLFAGSETSSQSKGDTPHPFILLQDKTLLCVAGKWSFFATAEAHASSFAIQLHCVTPFGGRMFVQSPPCLKAFSGAICFLQELELTAYQELKWHCRQAELPLALVRDNSSSSFASALKVLVDLLQPPPDLPPSLAKPQDQ